MKKIKAVVLDKSGSRYTVLDENGSFRHVHRRQNAEVGEEIEIRLASLEGFGGLRAWAGVAAMFLLVLTTLFAWNLYQAPTAVALLSVDINPSIQFTIDDQGNLLKVNTKNEDAERLLSKIELKGNPIDKVLEQIVTEAYNQKFLNAERSWIIVGYSPLVTEVSEHVDRNLSENQIVSWLKKDFEKNGFTPQVAFFALNPQERELAQNENLTLGEYALWQTAVKAGVATQPDELRDTLERVQLLENSKVQAQVKEDKKGLESSSPPAEDRMFDKGKDQALENRQQKQGTENQNNNENRNKNKNKNKNESESENENGKENDQPQGNDKDKGIKAIDKKIEKGQQSSPDGELLLNDERNITKKEDQTEKISLGSQGKR